MRPWLAAGTVETVTTLATIPLTTPTTLPVEPVVTLHPHHVEQDAVLGLLGAVLPRGVGHVAISPANMPSMTTSTPWRTITSKIVYYYTNHTALYVFL